MKLAFALPCAITALGLSFTSPSAQQLGANAAARGSDFAVPVDATPSPDGNTFYFIAVGANGPSVFRVGATGGSVSLVAAGAPFVNPAGLAVGTDGTQLYVAGRSAFVAGGRAGQIFVVPAAGGTAKPIRRSRLHAERR